MSHQNFTNALIIYADGSCANKRKKKGYSAQEVLGLEDLNTPIYIHNSPPSPGF